MKRTLAGAVILLFSLLSVPVFAIETLSLYDNFSSSAINFTKWTGSTYDALDLYNSVVIYAAGDGKLRMQARGYGFRTSSGVKDGRSTNNSLRFRRSDPNLIRAIKATAKVNSAVASGCPTAGSEVTQSRFQLGGYFFNAGGGEPGRATNDVLARIEVRRLSNSTVANQLDVRGAVWRCLDTECAITQALFDQQIGTILVGQPVNLLLQWDPPTNRFLFQVDANPIMSYTYTFADAVPPQNFFDKKTIGIDHYVANCVATQTQAFMSVDVDDVFVNTQAATIP